MSEDAGLDPAGTAEDQGDVEGAGTVPDDITEEGIDDTPDLTAELEKWKASSRKWERQSKENKDAAKELAEIKKAGMSEQEKLQAELAEATRERDEARTTHSRVMAAAAHDLPVELIDHLGAGTDEEINERAEIFSRVIQEAALALAGQIVAEQGVARNGLTAARPVESMRAGSAPASGDQPTTPDQWFRQLLDNR